MSDLSPAAQFAAAAAAAASASASAATVTPTEVAESDASSTVTTSIDKAVSEFPPVSPSTNASTAAAATAAGYAASVAAVVASKPADAPEPAVSDTMATSSAAVFGSSFVSAASMVTDAVTGLSVANVPPPSTNAAPATTENIAPLPEKSAADESHVSAAAMFESAVDSAVSSNFGDSEDVPAEKRAVATPKTRKPIDLADEELFPSLSSTAPPRPAPASWGARSGSAAASASGGGGRASGLSSAAVPGPQSMAQQLKLNQTTEIIDLPMMQDSVADTARKIMERTKTRIEISHNKVLKTSTYLITGKPDNVARAKREVCSKLSPRITKILQIPASVRAQVVGVRGRTLQTIQTQTGTVIALPKMATKSMHGDGDDDIFALADISITGDSIGVHSAIAQIEELVDKRTTKRAMRLADIPREAYALLVGKNGETLQVFQQAHPGVRMRIPGPLATGEVICVAGERSAVQAAAADLQTAALTLIDKSQIVTVAIPKRQHQFIVGSGGQTLSEIMRASGCHVSIPPPRSASDQIVVRGPESSLVQALGLVMAKANSAVVETVDPTAIHTYGRPLLYVNRALQYFHNRNRFRRIESEHGVVLRVPSVAAAAAATSPNAVLIEIQGKDAQSVAAARDAVSALFVAFPPYHFNSIDVEPHLFPLLAGRDGANTARLQAARSVYTLFPSDPSSHAVLVVYEGFNPDIDRIVDASTREGATRDLLRKTLEEFRTTIQSDDSHTTRTTKIPPALQRTLCKESEIGAILKAANAQDVVVRFGSATLAQAEPESTRTVLPRNAKLEEDDVEVKGLAHSVDAVVSALAARIKDHEEYQRLHSFTGEVAVPQQQMARVIGRGGDNIKRMRDAHDVTIDITDGTGSGPGAVHVRGTREGVSAAVAELQEFVERMADQTSDTVTVPAAIHKSLIGTGGRYVKKLEDKYAVRIQFPSARRDAGDDSPALSADEIRIRGGRKGVEGAKAELLELAAYEAEHNHTVRFTVPAECLPHVVGRAGANINEIKDDSNTRINFGDALDGRVEATVVGTRAGVRLAREAIEAVVAEHEAQVDVVVQVPVRHHRFLIGSQGSRVRELVQSAGGNPDATTGASACRVQFPRASENSDSIRIRGDRSIVEAVRERLEQLVAERERMTTVAVSIPISQHAFVIGRGGAHLKQLQDEHSVEIHFRSRGPSRVEPSSEGTDPSTVRITGLPENCDACKTALLALVRDEARLSVPLAIHQRLGGRTGMLWRRMRNEFDVQVDAASVDKAPPSRIDESTDTSADTDVVFNDPTARLAGLSAEWVLRGEKTKLASALDLINAQIKAAEHTTEARVRLEQRFHKLVIGKQGANIARIREASGCEITVPKRGSSSQWIVVTGDRTGADHAIEMIRESIDERD
ncbi:hypothetical protein IW140_005038 [Coemansia sp. RSA 1813]|nr:hypothetical protein LPJ74_003855 [Coemansia sp. RSA 1843]KAJ2087292.1 hypothetical protein IW138_005072 [Coemansia sp. RSA 986]KAJ2212157.1 hypothetical protein EV179_004893 [Coemansia sp. RSA 487]KAJ2566170.1 hypothetical protein IW140_005038 [Coemansia sp. RSA 1813]